MQDRRKQAFFWLFAILAVTVLVLALALRPTRVGEMQAMTNRIVELKLESRSRKMPRSVLHGKLEPGNAWEEYNIALNDAQSWSEGDNGSIFSRFLAGDTKVDRAKVKRLVATHKEAIEHLRLGAQRSDGQYPYAWEKIPEMELRIPFGKPPAGQCGRGSGETLGRRREIAGCRESPARRIGVREGSFHQQYLALQLNWIRSVRGNFHRVSKSDSVRQPDAETARRSRQETRDRRS